MVSPCAFVVLLFALVEGSSHPEFKNLNRVLDDDEQIKKIIKDLNKDPGGHLKDITALEKRLDARLEEYKTKLKAAIERAQALNKQIHTDFAKEAYLVETHHLRQVRPLIRGLAIAAAENKKKGDDYKVENEQYTGWRPKLPAGEDPLAGERATRFAELMAKTPQQLIQDISTEARAARKPLEVQRQIADQIAMIIEHRDQETIQRLAGMALDEAQKIREFKIRKALTELAVQEDKWKSGSIPSSSWSPPIEEIRTAVTSNGAKLPEKGLDEAEMKTVKDTARQYRAERLADLVLKSVVFKEATLSDGTTTEETLLKNLHDIADVSKRPPDLMLWEDSPAWINKMADLTAILSNEAEIFDSLTTPGTPNPTGDRDIADYYLGSAPVKDKVEKIKEKGNMLDQVNKVRKEALAKMILDEEFHED